MKINLLLIFCIALLFSSCSEYQRVLKRDDLGKKYAFADSLYSIGKYKKALKLMEQIVPEYRGKPQAEKLMFIYANTFYKLEDFYLAGYQFERFEAAYPSSDSVEIASFKSAKSFYELSPKFSLDQKETQTGLEKLQKFINNYPNSTHRQEANQLVKELREKLEFKEIEVADQYLHIEQYKAAIDAYDNFILDHPGSVYRKGAFYNRFVAAYKLAINSIPVLVQKRLLTAKDYYNTFVKYYKDSELQSNADKIMQDIESKIVKTEPSI